MNRINLMKYVQENWRIIINENFKQDLKSKIKEQKLKIEEISELTGNSSDSIWKFHQNRINPTLNYLLTLCKKLKVNEEKLHNNITAVYVGAKKASFSTKFLTINEEFATWWGAWIGEGNHTSTHESISMTNYEISLLKLHIYMMKKLNFPIGKMLIEVITNKQENEDLAKNRWSQILNLPKNQITSVTYMKNATQEGARVQVWSAGLFRILHAIDDEVKQKIINSPKNVKIGYIRGIFAAEGSLRKNQIRIAMKDQEEIKFIKEIFDGLEIKTNQSKVNKCNGAYELSIFGYDEIKKFIQIDGFKLYPKRKNRLEKMFSSYGKLPFHVSFRRIKRLLEQEMVITNKKLVQELGLRYYNAAFLTRKFTKERKLIADKSEKEYKYSLN